MGTWRGVHEIDVNIWPPRDARASIAKLRDESNLRRRFLSCFRRPPPSLCAGMHLVSAPYDLDSRHPLAALGNNTPMMTRRRRSVKGKSFWRGYHRPGEQRCALQPPLNRPRLLELRPHVYATGPIWSLSTSDALTPSPILQDTYARSTVRGPSTRRQSREPPTSRDLDVRTTSQHRQSGVKVTQMNALHGRWSRPALFSFGVGVVCDAMGNFDG